MPRKDDMFDQESYGSLNTPDIHSLDAPKTSDLVLEPSCSEAQNRQIHKSQRTGPRPCTPINTEDVDHYPMPTFEQVAKSMTRALRFQNTCSHQEEFARQVAEGRHMARAEKDGRAFREDRPAFNSKSRDPRVQNTPTHNAQPPGAHPGSNKRRSRHRNRSGTRAPQSATQSA